MLGLDRIMDPDFQQHVKAFADAIAETRDRCRRIEAKLDALSLDLGAPVRTGPTFLPPQHGADGSGSPADTGGAVDGGGGVAAAQPDPNHDQRFLSGENL
jgi:hypothetical protein